MRWSGLADGSASPSRARFGESAAILTAVVARFRRVACIVAVVLLALTAVDLSYPQCCALEQAGSDRAATSNSDVHPTPGAADDCFCCARCIDPGIRPPVLESSFGRVVFVDAVPRLISRSVVPDHPPQNA